MKDYGQEDVGAVFGMQSFLQLMRAVGAILGVIAIIIGLVYVTRIFGLVLGGLQAPENFNALLGQWIKAVGGEQLDIVVAGTTVHGANIAAITILGGGVLVLAWIAMGLVIVGAKVLSWTLGDREAIKKILASAFGPEKKANKSVTDTHGN